MEGLRRSVIQGGDRVGRFFLQFLATFTLGVGGFSIVIFGLAGAPSFVHFPSEESKSPSSSCDLLTPRIFYRYLLMACVLGACMKLIVSLYVEHGSPKMALLVWAWMLAWFLEALRRQAFVFVSVWLGFVLTSTFLSSSRTLSALPISMFNKREQMLYRWFRLVFKTSLICGLVGCVLFSGNILWLFIFIDTLVLDLDHLLGRFEKELLVILYAGFFGMAHAELVAYLQNRIQGKKVSTGRIDESMRRVHACKLCGDDLNRLKEGDAEQSQGSRTLLGRDHDDLTLECLHSFHETCLRGWALSGKKVTCPYCAERSRRMEEILKSNPWAQTDEAWTSFLAFSNFFFVFLPIGMGLAYALEGLWFGLWLCSPLYLFDTVFLLY